MQTQWRVGMAGPVGLDYNALYSEASRLDIDLTAGVGLMRKIKALERWELKRHADQGKNQGSGKPSEIH